MEYMVLKMIGSNLTIMIEVNLSQSMDSILTLLMLKHGVPQGSVLGPILFLIYINDLNHAIKCCKVHHFADDTNLLHFNSSTKKLNRLVSLDIKHLSVWLNANRISLNVQKTELVIFKQKRKILDHEIKIKLNRKRLYPTPSVK